MTNIINSQASTFFVGNVSAQTTNATGDGTVFSIPVTVLVQGSGLNTGTGVYTVPLGDRYVFGFKAFLLNIGAAHTKAVVSLVTTAGSFILDEGNPASVKTSASTFIMHGDLTNIAAATSSTAKVTIAVYGGTKTVGISCNFFAGRRFN